MTEILYQMFVTLLIIMVLVILPLALTLWNLITFVLYLIRKKGRPYHKWIEIFAMRLGILYLGMYFEIADIVLADWDVQLYNSELHSMISPDTFPTILVITGIAFLGYLLLQFIPVRKQPPAVTALGISAMYLGIGINVLWCIQTAGDFFLMLLSVNCIVIFVKTIYLVVYQKNLLIQNQTADIKRGRLTNILNNAANLPWAALLLVIPLLGVIVVLLLLFGQEPNSIIKAWTETADWTFSQKIAPQNAFRDEHYLCTVAAGGHRRVVKPIRTVIRHGHRVVVNRQLCVANAFEQVLEEKIPRFHKIVRRVYDRTGYPVSRHIRSQYAADLVYFLMKPLEWLFLLVLYTVDVNPENRIAVQYPHAPIPGGAFKK